MAHWVLANSLITSEISLLLNTKLSSIVLARNRSELLLFSGTVQSGEPAAQGLLLLIVPWECTPQQRPAFCLRYQVKNKSNKQTKSSTCSRKGEFTFYGISFITSQSSLPSLEFVASCNKWSMGWVSMLFWNVQLTGETRVGTHEGKEEKDPLSANQMTCLTMRSAQRRALLDKQNKFCDGVWRGWYTATTQWTRGVSKAQPGCHWTVPKELGILLRTALFRNSHEKNVVWGWE